MATSRAESISRIRNILKSVKEDPFITDRFIFSMIMKYAKLLIRRQANEGKIIGYNGLFQFIPCMELIELDVIPSCCIGIKTGCTIKRTKDKLPTLLEGSMGPIFRTIASLDLSTELRPTYPAVYSNLTKLTTFKYNKDKYYWYMDGYLYVPDVEWDAIYVEGIFDDNIAPYVCDSKPEDSCLPAQSLPLNIPEYLLAEVEQMALKEMLTSGQIPSDGPDDGQNILR